MNFVGVDPGTSGAAVCIDGNRQFVSQVRFSKAADIDVVEWFKEYGINSFVILEKVHSMPKQGVASTFKFGMAFGKVQGVMMGCGVAFEFCSPQAWQKALQVPPRKGESDTDHKRVLKNIACQLYNGQGLLIVKENADALLIAEYCRQKHGS